MRVLEKGCVHIISAQRVPYSGTVPMHQMWTLPNIIGFRAQFKKLERQLWQIVLPQEYFIEVKYSQRC